MCSCPFPDEPPRGRRPDLAPERTTDEVECAVLSLMFGVEVLRFVIIEVHPDDDPEKCGDDRHVAMLANASVDSLTDPSSPAWTRTRTRIALATRRVAGPRRVQRGVGWHGRNDAILRRSEE